MPIQTDPRPKTPPPMRGGGCLIAAGLVIGPVVGLIFGQTSMGLFAGLAIGIVAAIVLTVLDRRR
jgi:uncharacterized membrane protein